jgi:hypothetical protein
MRLFSILTLYLKALDLYGSDRWNEITILLKLFPERFILSRISFYLLLFVANYETSTTLRSQEIIS